MALAERMRRAITFAFMDGVATTAAIFGASGGIGGALVEALLARGYETIHAGTRGNWSHEDPRVRAFHFDYDSPPTMAAAADRMAHHPPDLVIVATGALTLRNGAGPEKTYRSIESEEMARAFLLNTIGPALVAKHMLPLFPRQGRRIFAALSARVGSIGDNRVGGWHSYRASKAALNMLIRNFATELRRTRPDALAVGLHPGTVDTALSKPFQANLPQGQLFTPQRSADALLDVLHGLGPDDSGHVFAWDGQRLDN